MLGKLDLSMLPSDPIIITAGILMILAALGGVVAITYFKKWTWLWKEWLTTVDHKKIGIMYIIVAIIMLLRGFAEATFMRLHQAVVTNADEVFLHPDHYDQFFTTHGVILIIFMAMPLMAGLVNIAVPLQIGARDVAFPFLNALSFWLFVAGAILVNMSLLIGQFSTATWVGYPELSLKLQDVGVDYYIWSIQISGIGTTLFAINFFVTILKMRAPGMSLMKMPIFSWSILYTSILTMVAFPVLAVTLALLFLDRYFGTNFFTDTNGGMQMLYVNMFWIWGHPEVYILIMPAFGIFSEIAATFSRKKLFGYTTMVWALGVICFLSFIVWVHHFFTMGAGANVNAFFGIATMIIAVPTGVKIFNWLFTMYKGKVRLDSPMLWLIGFIITFTFGGMTGVILSIPALDFEMHNSLFLVAHFHNTIIGGVVFGYLAGVTYWFPKAMGFRLNETLGKAAFWCWLIGFYVAFVPIYIAGMMGAVRRLSYHPPELQPLFIIAAIGALIIALGIVCIVLQFLVSIIKRKEYRVDNDPWDGRTLEWSISSPPAFYNFATIPHVQERDDFWYQKKDAENGIYRDEQEIVDIHMPKYTAIPLIMAGFFLLMGISFVFHIYWLNFVSIAGIIVCLIMKAMDFEPEYNLTADEIKAVEAKLKESNNVA